MFKENSMPFYTREETTPPEGKFELPKEFEVLRDKISEQVKLPLEKRFGEEELSTLITWSEEKREQFIRGFTDTHGEKPTKEDVEKEREAYTLGRRKSFERGLTQAELREVLRSIGMFDENKFSSEAEKERTDCSNGICLLWPEVQGEMHSYGETDQEKLGGDYFFIHKEDREGVNVLDATLMDAEGHGTKCAPLAGLSARFIREAQKAGVPYEKIMTELDNFIDSLPIHRKTISFIHATIETNREKNTKELSVLEAGVGGYVFWIDGNKEEGYKLRIIVSEAKIPENNSIESIALAEESATVQAGEGLIGIANQGKLVPEKFNIPGDASVFLSTDGLFDSGDPESSSDPKKQKHFMEELSEFAEKFFEMHGGESREEIENSLFSELHRKTEEYTQTDDITWFKLAA